MYQDAKRMLSKRGYASISELIRDVLRDELYPEVSENGFTPEFEERVLKAAKEPISEAKTWKNTKDIDKYFKDLSRKIGKNAKDKENR